MVNSLRDFNAKILKQSGIEEIVDDYIYLTVKLTQPTDFKRDIPV